MHIHLIEVNDVGVLISLIRTMHQPQTRAKRKAAFKKVVKAMTAMSLTNSKCSYIGVGLDSVGNPLIMIGEPQPSDQERILTAAALQEQRSQPPLGKKRAKRKKVPPKRGGSKHATR